MSSMEVVRHWLPEIGPLLAGLVGLLLLDAWRLRRAARRIDLAYSRLSREPSWTAMSPDQVPASLRADLESQRLRLEQERQFRTIGWFDESDAAGRVGVRVALVSADGTTVATSAASVRQAKVRFRSLYRKIGEESHIVINAPTISSQPAHRHWTSLPRTASDDELFAALEASAARTPGAAERLETAEAYIHLQRSFWRDAHAMRQERDYIVDLEALRRLAPRTLSERRLRRLHRLIVRRHAAARGRTAASG